jgi:hypothetical protein
LEVYFDESRQFGAPNPGEDGLAVVVGVIIPENRTEALRRDFLSFAATLPKVGGAAKAEQGTAKYPAGESISRLA